MKRWPGTIPLVHNSDMLGNGIYHYEGWDVGDGAQQVLDVIGHHESVRKKGYDSVCDWVVHSVDCTSDSVVGAHTRALEALYH